MTGINRILSGQISPSRPLTPVGGSTSEPSQQSGAISTPLRPDRFTMGQPWQNKASVSGGNGRWGAQAYAEQQQRADTASVAESAQEGGADDQEVTVSVTSEKGPTGEPLQPEELAQLQELQKIDQKVRAHEQAHMSAAGGLATSGISLSLTKGPDGQNYAVGGEVSIDTSRASTPRETISKMMKVRAAALAPADPSGQDRKVAASASVVMGEARAELQVDQQQPDTSQVVEQAGQAMVGRPSRSGAAAEESAPVNRVGYQQSQYQRANASSA